MISPAALWSHARRTGVFLALGVLGTAGGWAASPFSEPDTTTAADSVVIFNEILYHPAGDDPALEWVELYNPMSVDIELSNWVIEGGIDYRIPAGTVIAANGYVVVAADPAGLRAAVGITNVFGPFAGHLSNSGETLRLRNHNRRLMDELSYLDVDPWPVAADGSDASLAKREKFSASSPAANWRPSAQVGGTPGRANFPETELAGPVIDTMLGSGSASRWRVPADDSAGQAWTLPIFDDASWAGGSAALGFDAAAPAGAPAAARAYSFEGDIADVSGHGYDGVNSGARYVTNTPPAVGWGQSAEFDGVSNQVTVNDPVNPSAYTLAAWVSVDAVRASSLIVRTDGAGPMVNWSHQLRINAAGRFEHYVWDGTVRLVEATNVIQPGVWYHVAGTAASGGDVRIYVNGVSSGGSVPVGSLWPGGTQWAFGTASGGTPYYFRGRLDEAGIWHSVLGAADIARLAAGAPPALLDGFHSLIKTDVQSSLLGIPSSLYVRMPFDVPPGVVYDRLTLIARYDDGFVAYLNGVEVARRNAPQNPAWNAVALQPRDRADALRPEAIVLDGFVSNLAPGRNVLSVQVLNSAADDPDLLFTAELSGREGQPAAALGGLGFSEVEGANAGAAFFVELSNHGAADVALSGCRILSSRGGQFEFGAGTLTVGGYLALGTNQLGYAVTAGDKLFLLGPGQSVLDGVRVEDRLRGRLASDPAGRWYYPSAPTPGAANVVPLHDEIVINEILYHAPSRYATNATHRPTDNPEQWVELYNRSAAPVDLGGWRLEGGAGFAIPAGTVLGPGAYLVVANNAAALRARDPGITVLGDFTGKLSHRSDRVALVDARGNPANEVTYHDDAPWPSYADGGGSSLELRDPRADNSVPEAWAASVEGAKSAWRRYRYVARAINPVYAPTLYSFHEFRLGLLGQGEVLFDNVSVTELPTNAAPRQLLQNTDFNAGTAKWRLTGNHSHSRVEPDPDDAANPVLRLVATGPMTYLENQLETTLKSAGVLVPVVAGRDYEIAFDARWLAGSPQVHTELYYNKVAATTILDTPEHCGTPGRPNSTRVSNAGPTYRRLEHSPVLPTAHDAIAVSVEAADPDGIGSLALRYSVNDGAWNRVPMAPGGPNPGAFTGTIPPQPAGAVIRFYVEGTDATGALSTCPAGGADSRALIQVDAPRFAPGKQTFRIVMTPGDAGLLHSFVNLMSDDRLGCTVIHNEREVFYDAQIRLHGSMFSRPDAATTGFTVTFPADHAFRGSRRSVVVRRSGMVESFLKHILNQAGGLPGNYDDIVYLVSHRADNRGPARLNLANYDDTYVESQFERAADGTVFKLEGIRVYETTTDGTPEGYKLPQPVDFVWSYDIRNLGDDPEQYRWSVLIESRRARDDFSSVVAMGKALGLVGTPLQQAAGASLDVDEWARYFALQNLLGIADIYGVDNPHNIAFYARSDDGRIAVLQNDWGFAFSLGSGGSIYGTDNVYKMLRLPVYRRLYQGHLLDLVNSVYNSAYLTRWAQHYSAVTGENYSSAPAYAAARGASVRSQLAPVIPFEITSNGGTNFAVDTPTVTLEGRGWIDVREIRRPGREGALPVTWLDDQRWQAVVPLDLGANDIQLAAYDHRGAPVGQDAITVTTSVASAPQRDDLRVSELMYHPPPPNAAETAAGFVDDDDFEFIELLNAGPFDVPLVGVRFTAGVIFDFTAGSVTNLAAGGRVLIVKNRAAFEFLYGAGLPVAGEYSGSLDNGGEIIRLVDATGLVIQEFLYDDGAPWPVAADGGGSSLEPLDVRGDFNNPANWQASAVRGGSPGTRGVIPPGSVGAEYIGGQVRVRFQAAGGQAYTVSWCDDLVAGSWTALAVVPAGDGPRTEEVVDDPPAGTGQRFYRVSTP